MLFKPGDLVAVLDDTLNGVVTAVCGSTVTVEIEAGFVMDYETSELIKITDSSALKVSNFEIAQIKAEKEIPKRKTIPKQKYKERNAPKMEVDLHIHQLTKSSKGMSNHEMLNLQLATAQRQLEFAIRKRIQKVVFIHGVGEGVLKEELYYLFKRYDQLKYYDADYQKYGLGATEVYIYQNG